MWQIYGLFDWHLWLSLVWFGIALAISWFVPGFVLLHATKLSKLKQFYLAPILGLCCWALQGYVFGWVNQRYLTYAYLTIFCVSIILKRKLIFPVDWRLHLSKKLKLLIIVGAILQLIPVFGSGIRTAKGITFYFVNISDGEFHLSLARALISHVPPYEPGAAGVLVKNYHYLSNLVMAELTRVWGLPLDHLYFQFVPIFFSIWFGLVFVVLIRGWSKHESAVFFGLLIFYATGEISWLANILLHSHSTVPFEVFIDHGVLQFLNPPQAFAKIVFFGVLILLHDFWKTKNVKLAVMIGIMVSTMIGFKVYFGMAAILGIAAAFSILIFQAFFQLMRSSKKSMLWKSALRFTLPYATIAVITGVVGAAIYLPTNAQSGGLFFDLNTWPKLLLSPSKLNWDIWWLRLQVYEAAHNIRSIVLWQGVALAVFLFSIYHIRLLGFAIFHKRLRGTLSIEEIAFVLVPSVLFTVAGTQFLQASGGANSFNFLVVALTILNLVTAVVLGEIAQRKSLAIIVLGIILVTTVQTVVVENTFIDHYQHQTNTEFIGPAHEAALNYLASFPHDSRMIQTFPGQYLNRSTPYLYFYTGQQNYLGGYEILESHNQQLSDRNTSVSAMFAATATASATLANSMKITDVLIMHNDPTQEHFYQDALLFAHDARFPHWDVVFNNAESVILDPVLPDPSAQMKK